MPRSRKHKRTVKKRYRTFNAKTRQQVDKIQKEFKLIEQIGEINAIMDRLYKQPQLMAELFHNEEMIRFQNYISYYMKSGKNIFQPILNLCYGKSTKEEESEINNTNEKIIAENYQPDQEKKIDVE